MKIGDYFIIIKDDYAKIYNGNIGIITGECDYPKRKWYGKLLTKYNNIIKGDVESYPFNENEVRKISKEEAFLELL